MDPDVEDEITVRRCELLLESKFTSPADPRLVAQVGLVSIRLEAHRELLSHRLQSRKKLNKHEKWRARMEVMREVRLRLEGWYREWVPRMRTWFNICNN
jgi:hypothetical protein